MNPLLASAVAFGVFAVLAADPPVLRRSNAVQRQREARLRNLHRQVAARLGLSDPPPLRFDRNTRRIWWDQRTDCVRVDVDWLERQAALAARRSGHHHRTRDALIFALAHALGHGFDPWEGWREHPTDTNIYAEFDADAVGGAALARLNLPFSVVPHLIPLLGNCDPRCTPQVRRRVDAAREGYDAA